MNERGDAAKFKLQDGRPMPWATINRHSVAASILALTASGSYSCQAPFILRS